MSLGIDADVLDGHQVELIDAGPASELVDPADLLGEIRRLCHPPGRRLLLFESLDSMVRAWGANKTRAFFSRCCPFLLEVGAVAYWCMSARRTPATVRATVESVTQCVLRVDERSVRVVKAEGRDEGARGSVLHCTRSTASLSSRRLSLLVASLRRYGPCAAHENSVNRISPASPA